MIRKLLLSLCFLFTLIAARADDKQKIASKAQHIVVFLNGAQVMRTASVSVAPGNSVLEFTNISPDIDMQSLQVKANGDFTILSVKQEFDYLNQQTQQKRVEELQAQQKIIRDKIELQSNALNVYTEEQNMLLKNQVVSGQNANLDILKLKQALDFQTQRLTEIKKKQQGVNDQIALLNIELQKYNKQIAELYKGNTKATSNILVTVSAKSTVQSQFTLTYVVNNASWYPTYDIRAKNVNSPISIAYKANVTQQCGEDWNNIKLTLSTGNPSVNGSKPELLPYYLNLGMVYGGQAANINSVSGRVSDDTGAGLASVTVKVTGTSIGATSDLSGHYSIQLPQGSQTLTFSYVGFNTQNVVINSAMANVTMTTSSNALNEVVATGYLSGRVAGVDILGTPGNASKIRIRGTNSVRSNPISVQQNETQTNVEFNIDNPYTIPSDGKQYLVEINKIDVAADFEYYTAPKISTDVFLTAKLTNWNQYSFLPGEANLFFENTFIGKSLLDTRSTADTLSLSLGTDKNIVVTRTTQKDLSEKQGILGSNKKETRNWLINVKNRKLQPINLLVEDQVPVSQNSAIEVDVQAVSGGKTDTNTGKISWNLNLAPQAEKKLELKYQVKYPKNQSIIVQ